MYIPLSDMKLKIRWGTVGYNNKILVSNSGLSLERTIRSMLELEEEGL